MNRRTKLTTKWILIATGIAALAAVYWIATNAFFLESARYTVTLKEGDFEVREYPELSVASTRMKSPEDESGFRKLFRYIQGNNDQKRKIAMTTPVFVDGDESSSRMSFVVPKEIEQEGIPAPTSGAVVIDKRPATRVAAYRYSGVADPDSNEKALYSLRIWMAEKNLKAEGEAIYAYYDAPFIPGPFRRNEVMLQIK
jgi:hypothetical protein